jgi:hypothetical protein
MSCTNNSAFIPKDQRYRNLVVSDHLTACKVVSGSLEAITVGANLVDAVNVNVSDTLFINNVPLNEAIAEIACAITDFLVSNNPDDECSFQTIQSAIDQASAEFLLDPTYLRLVYVKSGLYTEDVTFMPGVSLLSDGGATINGTFTAPNVPGPPTVLRGVVITGASTLDAFTVATEVRFGGTVSITANAFVINGEMSAPVTVTGGQLTTQGLNMDVSGGDAITITSGGLSLQYTTISAGGGSMSIVASGTADCNLRDCEVQRESSFSGNSVIHSTNTSFTTVNFTSASPASDSFFQASRIRDDLNVNFVAPSPTRLNLTDTVVGNLNTNTGDTLMIGGSVTGNVVDSAAGLIMNSVDIIGSVTHDNGTAIFNGCSVTNPGAAVNVDSGNLLLNACTVLCQVNIMAGATIQSSGGAILEVVGGVGPVVDVQGTFSSHGTVFSSIHPLFSGTVINVTGASARASIQNGSVSASTDETNALPVLVNFAPTSNSSSLTILNSVFTLTDFAPVGSANLINATSGPGIGVMTIFNSTFGNQAGPLSNIVNNAPYGGVFRAYGNVNSTLYLSYNGGGPVAGMADAVIGSFTQA